MLLIRPLLIALGLMVLPFGQSVAIEVSGLNEAEVLVGQSPEDQDRGFREALLAVLVKASGRRELPQSGPVAAALAQASRYVQQYRYRDLPPGGSTAPGTRLLWVEFDPGTVNRVLTDAGLPVLGDRRPLVLLWLGREDGRGSSTLAAEDADPLAGVVADLSRERGLPVFLPLLDLEDRSRLADRDLWAESPEGVLGASRRYGPDAVLLARLRAGPAGDWEGRWTLWMGDRVERWAVRDPRPEVVVERGLDRGLDQVALWYGGDSVMHGGKDLELSVLGVHTFAEYGRLLAYLRNLHGVDALDVTRVHPDRLELRLRARVSEEALDRAFALGRTLSPVGQPQERTFRFGP